MSQITNITDTLADTVSVAQEVAAKVTEGLTPVIESINAEPTIATVNIVLAVIGALMFAVIELQIALKKNKEKFSLGYWVKTNWIQILLTGITLTVIFLLAEEAKDLCGFDVTYKVGSFLAGLTSHAIMMKIVSMRNTLKK